jgi:hypothetical protein
VRQGGKPYDIRGNHITETVNEIAVLSRFNRASANRILEGVTQELVTEAQAYYQSLRENLKHMASNRGYQTYFESWHPATINEQEDVVNSIKTLFIEQSIDSRIEAALPLLARIQQKGQEMKEAQIFENWINSLSEGTWNLPETPEQMKKLQALMTSELIVGPDATNATEQLYDLVGDDILFDRLHTLADQDPRANAWNDTEVMQRLQELGIDTPAPAQPQAPEQNVAEQIYSGDEEECDACNGTGEGRTEYSSCNVCGGTGVAEPRDSDDDVDVDDLGDPIEDEPLSYQERSWNVRESNDLDRMRGLAGLAINENVLTDSTGSTLQHIKDTFKRDVKDFTATGEMSDHLFQALYDYYFDDMPYGIRKARDGDPYEWVSDRFAQDVGLEENLIAPQIMPVAEGSCNMTAEGEYCPEHGLAECGMGMPAGIMDEELDKPPHDDAINYNAAITGSYYESREGDTTLARIKSLALFK